MQTLNFPFQQTVKLTIANNAKVKQIHCELATSDIEIFQALNYRKKEDFKKPLALVFENPKAQIFTRFNFAFAVEQIAVDAINNEVKDMETIYPDTNNEWDLKGYSNYSLVILAPKGLIKSKNIQLHKTTIKV